MAKFEILIQRTEVSSQVFKVQADSLEEAAEIALAMAEDFAWTADYVDDFEHHAIDPRTGNTVFNYN